MRTQAPDSNYANQLIARAPQLCWDESNLSEVCIARTSSVQSDRTATTDPSLLFSERRLQTLCPCLSS